VPAAMAKAAINRTITSVMAEISRWMISGGMRDAGGHRRTSNSPLGAKSQHALKGTLRPFGVRLVSL